MQELPTVPSSAFLHVLSLKVFKNTGYKSQSLVLLLFQVHPETVSCPHHHTENQLQGNERTSGMKNTVWYRILRVGACLAGHQGHF